jgi:eukaryotic-like serine/threonine-protein kinase
MSLRRKSAMQEKNAHPPKDDGRSQGANLFICSVERPSSTHARTEKGGVSCERPFPFHTPMVALIVLLLLLVVACASNAPAPPVTIQKTPKAALAGGEPILPHSQIFLRTAPLPTAADMRVSNGDWTLPALDAASTRSVLLPNCCVTQTPAPLWFHSLGTPLLDAPIVSNGRIYLLAADGYLHVLSTQDGAEQWRLPVGGELAANGLALAHGLLYLGLAGHYIVALDAATGQQRWRFDTVGLVRAAPVVVGHEVLVASGPNSLTCLDAFTGEEYWAFHSEDALAQFWPTNTTPAIAGGVVYVALGASNEFNALNLQTGRKEWEASLHERMIGGPVLDETLGLLYVVTWSGHIVALDMRKGTSRWDFHLPGGTQSSPALSLQANVLYIGGYDGNMYALDAHTGQLRWSAAMGSAVTAPPVVVATATQTWLIVATQGGTCVIVNAQTGQQRSAWRLGELRVAPIIARGILYLASLGDQGLFAFRL